MSLSELIPVLKPAASFFQFWQFIQKTEMSAMNCCAVKYDVLHLDILLAEMKFSTWFMLGL